jgi:hypothetical protein
MEQTIRPRKRIGLVAHDNKKPDLTEWARFNQRLLVAHDLVATGTTGTLLEEELGVGIMKLQSGPLGGDQQIGAMIADGEIDILTFLDPLEPQPHDLASRPRFDSRRLEHPDVAIARRRICDLVAAHDQRLRTPDAHTGPTSTGSNPT